MVVKYKYSNLYYREKELEEPIARIIAPHTKLKYQAIGTGKSFEMSFISKVIFLKNHGNLLWQLTIDYKAVASDLSTTYNLCVSPIVISKCKSLKDIADYIIFLKDNNIRKRRLY